MDYAADIEELMSVAVNNRATFSEVQETYLNAIAKGYSPQDISRGYELYLTEYRTQHTTPRHVMRLDRFLRDADGLTFYKKPSTTGKHTSRVRSGTCDQQEDEFEKTLCDSYPQYAEMHRELSAAYAKCLQARLNGMEVAEHEKAIAEIKDRMESFKTSGLEQEVVIGA